MYLRPYWKWMWQPPGLRPQIKYHPDFASTWYPKTQPITNGDAHIENGHLAGSLPGASKSERSAGAEHLHI